MPYLFTW